MEKRGIILVFHLTYLIGSESNNIETHQILIYSFNFTQVT